MLLPLLTLLGSTLAAPHVFDSRDPLNPYSDGRRLMFKGDKFKVVLFSDLHYGERDGNNTWAEWGVWQDGNSTIVMDKALSDERPDFAVFGGDQITGENQLWENSTVFLDQILTPVRNHKVPFASVYGNHDESYNISHVSSYYAEKEYAPKLSWTQSNPAASGDPKGVFNYYIPVYKDKKSKVPSLLLWFFDSRAGTFNSAQFGVKDEPWMTQDWVDPKAATWINETAKAMKSAWGTLPKSMAFVHIPPTPARSIGNSVGDDHTGINFDEPVDTQGGRGQYWQSREVDLPFWHAVTGTLGGADGSGLVAITSGHDHGNDWCARDESVGPYSFCFARHTGYGGYGSWARGSRVFEATLKRGALDDVKSWVRMEDHSTANTTTLVKGGQTVMINTNDPAPDK